MDRSGCIGPAPENNHVSLNWLISQYLRLLIAYKIFLKATENLQYTKKVVIEQQRAHFEFEVPIVAPVISIERQRLESTSRNVHEYVLPLDAAWEFPRENLEIGEVNV